MEPNELKTEINAWGEFFTTLGPFGQIICFTVALSFALGWLWKYRGDDPRGAERRKDVHKGTCVVIAAAAYPCMTPWVGPLAELPVPWVAFNALGAIAGVIGILIKELVLDRALGSFRKSKLMQKWLPKSGDTDITPKKK